MNLYSGLLHYLEKVNKEYDVQITLKDFSGLLGIDIRLYRMIQPFTIHHSCYCMTIKSHGRLWTCCLKTKDFLYQRLLKNPETFYGSCYAGIGEFVVPIHNGTKLLGAFTVGNFASTKKPSKILQKVISNRELDHTMLERAYDSSTKPISHLNKNIEKDLQIIAEYLCLLYELKNQDEGLTTPSTKYDATKPYILSHAIEYLNLHATKNIKLSDIASYCHCSPSYISHQFKAYTGMNINAYVNERRVDLAKELLRDSNTSITDIAYEVGFKDSNYFSKVFRDLTGYSPNKYRKIPH